jgi:hypothetical protein
MRCAFCSLDLGLAERTRAFFHAPYHFFKRFRKNAPACASLPRINPHGILSLARIGIKPAESRDLKGRAGKRPADPQTCQDQRTEPVGVNAFRLVACPHRGCALRMGIRPGLDPIHKALTKVYFAAEIQVFRRAQ